MNFAEIVTILTDCAGEAALVEINADVPQPFVRVAAAQLVAVCDVLYRHEDLFFDQLSCLTALDNGPQAGTMEVLYHFNSIVNGHAFVVKVLLARNQPGEPLPEVPTLSHLWRTADWHEREAYDLLGIRFTDHPDLRRILLPADWQGHPLRKDYEQQQQYHGIRVEY